MNPNQSLNPNHGIYWLVSHTFPVEARRGAQGSSLVFLGIGSPDAKLSDVHFENVTFEYATWLRPSQGDGYVEQQSGVCV